MKKIVNIITIVIMFLSLSFVIYASFIFIKAQQNQELPNVFGYHILFVETGSMEPNLPVGSIIVVKKSDITTVDEEDIISFYSTIVQGSDTFEVVVTHRVVQVIDELEVKLLTQGDANQSTDIDLVTSSNYIGKMVLKITFLTFLKTFLSNTNLILMVVVVIVAIFVITEGIQLIRIFTKYKYEKEVEKSKESNTK